MFLKRKLGISSVVLGFLLFVLSISAHVQANEMWIAPRLNDSENESNQGVGDWVVTENGEARFSFAVPANMEAFTGATLVVMGKNDRSILYGLHLSVSQNEKRYDNFNQEISGRSATLSTDELFELDITDLFNFDLIPGEDYVSVYFKATKTYGSRRVSDARVVGLRFKYEGPQGPKGDTGPQGPQGFAGADGATGLKGDTGAMGPQGLKGDTGAKGDQGIQGIAGADGATGPQGTKGEPGTNGVSVDWQGALVSAPQTPVLNQAYYNTVDGVSYIYNGTSWDVLAKDGAVGTAGPQGEQGLQGTQGVAGTEGATGPQGPKGDTGAKGDQGPQGLQGVAGADGATGPQGLKGDTGAKGDQGSQGLQGIAGADGATGLQGQQGEPGANGATGPQGPQGVAGSTGPQGPAGASPFGLNGSSAYYTDGNVGIGTTNPLQKLHIVDSNHSMLRLETASNDLWNAGIQFHGGGTNANWTVGTNRSDIAGDVGNLFFNCNFGTKMVIQNTGNVGIGTMAPSEKLEVDGTVKATAFVGDGTGLTGIIGEQGPQGPKGDTGATGATGPQGPTGDQGLQGLQGVAGATGATGAQGLQGVAGATGPQGPAGASPFGLNGSSAYYTAGNVGIGTTIPNTALTVAGMYRGTGVVRSEGESGTIAGSGVGSELGASGSFAYLQGFNRTTSSYAPLHFYGSYVSFANCNVGIGTTAPGVNLHIKDSVVHSNVWVATENDARQYLVGVRGDASNSRDQFQIIDNTAGTVPRLVITTNGNVGIGTTSPQYPLHVIGSVYATGGWAGSDARWKKDIQPLENSLSNVLKLQGVSYLWKTEDFPQNGFTEGRQIGLIAQELEKVLPELVNTDNEGYKSVSYDKLTAILIEAVKEQQEQINALKSEKNAKIASLENDIAELKEAMVSAVMLTSVK